MALINLSRTGKREVGEHIPENIKIYGESPQSVYGPVLRNATIGIGTLALHRKNMEEACPLKTREYLANGLPVLIAYKDSDLSGKEEFVCQIPNREENITENLEKIGRFAKAMKEFRINRDLIRHIDSKVKERERLKYFLHIVNDQNART
jgi:hypothetical protein